MKVFITGVAGFIGMHVAQALLKRGDKVVGVDNLSAYYDISLKEARLNQLRSNIDFYFHKLDISNAEILDSIFSNEKPDMVIHLAAQAGVRYSIKNPQAYMDSNLQGFLNVIECCRNYSVKHLVYASSSSVYGNNSSLPFGEQQNIDHPLSLYAATKKANELMAHAYSHLYNLPTTGLRFFTVFGPWGRPDMALFLFANAILGGKPIDIFNQGNMSRDFTYIDDIVESIVRVLDKTPTSAPEYSMLNPSPAISNVPYRIFNVGNSKPTPLLAYIEALEDSLGKKAIKNFMPMQAGDVPNTWADTKALQDWINFRPDTSIQYGVSEFVRWFRQHYQI